MCSLLREQAEIQARKVWMRHYCTETSPANLTWCEIIRRMHTFSRGQTIEWKCFLSWWVVFPNQKPNAKLSLLQGCQGYNDRSVCSLFHFISFVLLDYFLWFRFISSVWLVDITLCCFISCFTFYSIHLSVTTIYLHIILHYFFIVVYIHFSLLCDIVMYFTSS